MTTHNFEQNNKIQINNVRDLVETEFEQLLKTNNRRPLVVVCEEVTKMHFGVALPDFILGVFRNYAMSKQTKLKTKIPREHIMFERLRDKYKLIYDADNQVEYGRRHQFIPFVDQ